MSEAEKERAYEFLKELDSYGKTYTADGRAIYVKEHVFDVIDKLQKENKKLKRQLKAEIYARDMVVSLNSNLKKENIELKEKIKEYEIGKEQE